MTDILKSHFMELGLSLVLAILTALAGAASVFLRTRVWPAWHTWASLHLTAQTEKLIEDLARRAAATVEEAARNEGWEKTGMAKAESAMMLVTTWLANQGYNINDVGGELKVRHAIRAAVFEGWNKYKLPPQILPPVVDPTAENEEGVLANVPPPPEVSSLASEAGFSTEQCKRPDGCISPDLCLQLERDLYPDPAMPVEAPADPETPTLATVLAGGIIDDPPAEAAPEQAPEQAPAETMATLSDRWLANVYGLSPEDVHAALETLKAQIPSNPA